ncbi:phytanoyl-CoA dioxygenase family protein [Streptomyces sp. NBC_00873]|uniref:phytanoyl-CoA dioxygenase family protein n=1 Tax=Streptomyces sp. NBC_00873 TaxID=2975852 RepID=UPI00386CCF59|nr:phytanoyl-CoA dioxygenase family protein [Streptomyces sp. NBC_00873]
MTSTPTTRRQDFDAAGFLNVGPLLTPNEVAAYQSIYDRFLDGSIHAGDKRSDLGAGAGIKPATARENITQIMWPSALHPELLDLPLHARALAVARELVGEDMVLDFDMLIDKAPHTGVPTPWHQDAGYWVDLPDKRAVSIWVALDEATLDNGCMWYVYGSHLTPLRPHWPASSGKGAIECACSEDEPGATYVPLAPGQAAAHAGHTLHYSRGNTTDSHRRAYILNYRSQAMIQLEREQGMDHGLTNNERLVRNRAVSRQDVAQ